MGDKIKLNKHANTIDDSNGNDVLTNFILACYVNTLQQLIYVSLEN